MALLIRDLFGADDLLRRSVRGGAVAIGNFDGVHRGHARIIERLVAQACAVDGPAVAFTFDPHPSHLLRPDRIPPPLATLARKAELLGKLGVDALVAFPTDRALLQLTPGEFFDRILRDQLAARAIVEGPNFRFGRDRTGTVDVLQGLCAAADVRLEIVAPCVIGDDFISSSRIRHLIAAGDIAAANDLLTEPYRIQGVVAHGAGRGATIGFPTANLADVPTLLPAEGVYAAIAHIPHPTSPDATQPWPAVVNLGPNPTFHESTRKVEAHVIGLDRPLYQLSLELEFLARLRDVQKFASVAELQAQLRRDIAQALQLPHLPSPPR